MKISIKLTNGVLIIANPVLGIDMLKQMSPAEKAAYAKSPKVEKNRMDKERENMVYRFPFRVYGVAEDCTKVPTDAKFVWLKKGAVERCEEWMPDSDHLVTINETWLRAYTLDELHQDEFQPETEDIQDTSNITEG